MEPSPRFPPPSPPPPPPHPRVKCFCHFSSFNSLAIAEAMWKHMHTHTHFKTTAVSPGISCSRSGVCLLVYGVELFHRGERRHALSASSGHESTPHLYRIRVVDDWFFCFVLLFSPWRHLHTLTLTRHTTTFPHTCFIFGCVFESIFNCKCYSDVFQLSLSLKSAL